MMLWEWSSAAPVESQLGRVLRATRDAFPLSGAVVRDERNALVAGSDSRDGLRPIPADALEPDTLLPTGTSGKELLRRLLPLPIDEGRVALVVAGRPLGWLDLWGNGSHVTADSRRALGDAARLIAILLADAGQRPRAGG